MNIKYLLMLLVLNIFSCGTPNIDFIKKYPDGKVAVLKKYTSNDDSSSYDITEYYHSGQVFKEAKVRSGKYIDRKVSYFESGVVKEIDSLSKPCNTDIHMCDGILIHYDETGKIADRRRVENNVFCGLTQIYDTNGLILREYDLIKDSIKNGDYREFYIDGKIAHLAIYKNDTLVHNEYYFDENGDTLKYYNHSGGIIDLPYKKWLSGGRTIVGNYSSDRKIVIWIWYDSNGKEIKRKIDNLKKNTMVVPE